MGTSSARVTLTRQTAANPPGLPLPDRLIVWGSLAAITALSWIYMIRMPMAPRDLGDLGARILGAMPARWADAWLTFMMWAVMMVAMMLPSASPMITIYARMAHGRASGYLKPVAAFAAGYVAVWTLFSAGAAVGQILLQHASLISNALSATPIAGSAILIAAGLYQLTPFKDACLAHCRSPIGFFMTEWRDGTGGAFRMGLKHGVFCVGCCWMLMAVLFAVGVMNLIWIAALSIFVLFEKIMPHGKVVANASGVILVAAGLTMAFHR